MSTEAKTLIDELYEAEGKAEIVRGEVVSMSPSGKWHGRAADNILLSLRAYERKHKRGFAFGDNVGFLVTLPNRGSFSPDVAWYVGEIGNLTSDDALDLIDGAPTFAIEIRSKNDYGKRAERKIAEKITDYFTSGTLAVWDVDLKGDEPIKLHLTDRPDNPMVFKYGETAHAEPILPGWKFPVDDLSS